MCMPERDKQPNEDQEEHTVIWRSCSPHTDGAGFTNSDRNNWGPKMHQREIQVTQKVVPVAGNAGGLWMSHQQD